MIASDTRNTSEPIIPSPLRQVLPTGIRPPWHHARLLRIQFRLALSIMTAPLLSARQDWNLKCISQRSAGPTCSLSLGSNSRSTESEWKLVRAEQAPGLAWAHTSKRSQRRSARPLLLLLPPARMRDLMGVLAGWLRVAWCTDDVKSSAFRNGWLVL